MTVPAVSAHAAAHRCRPNRISGKCSKRREPNWVHLLRPFCLGRTTSKSSWGDEGLFQLEVGRRGVFWIPESAKKLQVRLMVCVRAHEVGWVSWCRWDLAAVLRILPVVVSMEEHVADFVKQCLHCINSNAGEKVPRSLGRERVSSARWNRAWHEAG